MRATSREIDTAHHKSYFGLLILPVSLAKGKVSSHPIRCSRVILG